MAKTSYSKAKGRSNTPGGFAGVPRAVIKTHDYQLLNGNSVKLLLELASQYRGSNNGDLTVAYSLLRERGFNSKDTITRAMRELIKSGLVIKTREGVFTNPGGRCALYALAWQPIDECKDKGLDVAPTTTPPRKFSLEINRNPCPVYGQGSSLKSGRPRAKDSKGRFSSSLKSGRLTAVT